MRSRTSTFRLSFSLSLKVDFHDSPVTMEILQITVDGLVVH